MSYIPHIILQKIGYLFTILGKFSLKKPVFGPKYGPGLQISFLFLKQNICCGCLKELSEQMNDLGQISDLKPSAWTFTDGFRIYKCM